MSAFLCSARHLSSLVNAYAAFCPRVYRSDAARFLAAYAPSYAVPRAEAERAEDVTVEDAVFAMLLEENLASLGYRYGAKTDEDVAADYVYDPKAEPASIVAAFKAVSCYQYQACEHDGWKDSKACEFTTALVLRLTSYLPGYEDAPWGD